VAALRRLAGSELDPPLARRLQELSERKEFLDEAGHDEWTALVDFVQQRTIDKLEVQVAPSRLRDVVPEMVQDA
jgi:hypothetical protein